MANALKQIDSKIKTITSNGAKLNALIHETGMLIMAHAQEHGDCTRALSLVKAMPASMRRTMLIKWFETFSPVTVKLADDRVGINKGKNAKPFDLEAANAKPFYEMAEEEPEVKVYTLAQLIKMAANLGDRIEKMANNENEKAVVKADDKVKALEFAAKVKALAA